jgi:hypothetical protein
VESLFSLNFNQFLPVGGHISWIFTRFSLGKWQFTACPFQKEFSSNPRNVSTNRKKGITLCCLQNSLENYKSFDAKVLITYYFNKITKLKLKNL